VHAAGFSPPPTSAVCTPRYRCYHHRYRAQHVVEVSSKTGLVSILGGKWTTYRKMAEDAVDAVRAVGS
jgi:hypothetical protein